MAEKLDLDALERANLGRVVRPEDWMALLAYARALEKASQPASGDHHVREFEEWVKQTGALPWGGSWMAEVSSIIERAAGPSPWLPAKTETLPPEDTDVIVRGRDHCNALRHDVAGMFSGAWMSQATQNVCDFTVTDWMPIPRDAAMKRRGERKV